MNPLPSRRFSGNIKPIKNEKIKVSLMQFLFDALRVKVFLKVLKTQFSFKALKKITIPVLFLVMDRFSSCPTFCHYMFFLLFGFKPFFLLENLVYF